MQIAQARQKAEKFIHDNIQVSNVKRPAAEERVMVRYPKPNSPKFILAADEMSLREKLAKRIQADARRTTKH